MRGSVSKEKVKSGALIINTKLKRQGVLLLNIEW